MRVLLTLLCLFPAFSAVAVEPVDEQQVMIYYHIPLGANNQQDAKHQFGLRLDRTTHDPRDTVQLDVLEKQDAAMDFRMGYDGMQSLKIHGVDYASFLIARAAASEDDTAAAAAEVEGDAGTDTETAEETATGETSPEDEKTVVQKTLDDLPVGVWVGVLLGIGIIAGVGG